MDDGKDESIMVKWMNKGYLALQLDLIIILLRCRVVWPQTGVLQNIRHGEWISIRSSIFTANCSIGISSTYLCRTVAPEETVTRLVLQYYNHSFYYRVGLSNYKFCFTCCKFEYTIDINLLTIQDPSYEKSWISHYILVRLNFALMK